MHTVQLLEFTRAQIWERAFGNYICMPLGKCYTSSCGITNTYAELGAIYLCEMKKLPHDIKEEYQMGNFVVKMSKQKFNQMDTYQSQE